MTRIFSRSTPHIFFILLAPLIALSLLLNPLLVSADESPKPVWDGTGDGTGALFYQTTGGTTGCNDGNWLTCSSGVNGDHFYEIIVPSDWPASEPFHIDIYSPFVTESDDCSVPNTPCSVDEAVSASSTVDTTWMLYDSATTTVDWFTTPQVTATTSLVTTTYPQTTTTHAWVRYYTIPAPAAGASYILHEVVDWDTGTRNGFALRSGYDNDTDPTNAPPSDFMNPGGLTEGTPIVALAFEPELGGPRDGSTDGEYCSTYYYEAGPASVLPVVSFYFFDLDFEANATYRAPDGTEYTTSVRNASGWNGTGTVDTTDVATVLASIWDGTGTAPDIGDHFINTVDGGIWEVYFCFSSEDHFFFSGPLGELITTEPIIDEGSIGNYIWVDEDGDGDQDAGEAGIPGVTVTLTFPDGSVITTVTDHDGGYLFAGLPETGSGETYTVTVVLPAGMFPTYDEDGSLDNSTSTTLDVGEEHLSADFGFNWVPPTSTNDPAAGATGAVGDFIWNDADGDGIQDANESAIGDVTVELLDADGNVVATTMTDANGHYIFTGVDAGVYSTRVDTATLPVGFTPIPTGDPDGDGDATSEPFVLAPGDVLLTQDYGFTNPAGHTIGDTIFFDANADGDEDAGEPGIAGVTVALFDANGDVIATTTTDSNGAYSFPGLPDGTYNVVVTDTDNVLSGLSIKADPDSSLDGESTVMLSGADNLDQDFGYAPFLQNDGDGMIGDTVFLDQDGDGAATAGEGLEGVTVLIYDESGFLLDATTTDENGNYYFGNLDPTGTYTVEVNTTTLPAGVTNTVDPDGGTSSQSVVDLSLDADGIDLVQDFGYAPPPADAASLGGTIWQDDDADGTLEGDEATRFEGVTVALFNADGNLIGTTTTDASGDYSFDNLPPGDYTVDVVDTDDVLNGLWKSDGSSAGSDNNSQIDTYSVTLAAGDNNTTADFGYYGEPASIGNLVFNDANGNGVFDTGDVGLSNVVVTLTIDYPNGDQLVITTTTASDGTYSFDNLLLDEDYSESGCVDCPVYTVTVEPPADTQSTHDSSDDSTTIDGSAADENNADDPAGEPAYTEMGGSDTTNDFGFVELVDIGNFVWLEDDADGDATNGTPTAQAGIVVSATASDGTVYTATTDAAGAYTLTVPANDTYTVTVATPDGYVPSTVDATGADDMNSGSGVVVMVGDTDDTSIDFGFTPEVVELGNYVWLEEDADGDATNGTPTTQAGIVVTATASNGTVYTATTDAAGAYTLTVPANDTYTVTVATPDGYVPSTVDSAGADDMNSGSGVVVMVGDTDDTSIDFGFTPEVVELGNYIWLEEDADGDATNGTPTTQAGIVVSATASDGTVYTATTDAAGAYTLTVPANDTYTVTVATPDGYVPSTVDASGADNMNSGSGVVVMVGDEDDTTIDFGFTVETVELGNYVWFEEDADGDATNGTPTTQAGIVVSATASDGTVYTATTDAAGAYTLTVPANDTYTVTVATPDGYVPSTVDASGADNMNSGSGVVVIVGDEADTSIDFGFTEETNTVNIGNYVWLESDSDGDATTGDIFTEAGIIVTATATDGTVYTGTTDFAGLYTITVPANATYTVTVDGPSGLFPSMVVSGAGDNENHDANGTVVMVMDDDVMTIDFAFHIDATAVQLTQSGANRQSIQSVAVISMLAVLLYSTQFAYREESRSAKRS